MSISPSDVDTFLTISTFIMVTAVLYLLLKHHNVTYKKNHRRK